MTPRRILACAGIAALVIAVGLIGIGEVLIQPASRPVGTPPIDLHAQSIEFAGATGQTVSAWLASGTPGKGVVLLLHGVRGDRRAMLGRARLLQASGMGVMLMDLPAHGESTGAHITFGLHEAQGVTAALDYLRHALPQEHVGVIGVSLGAASLVLAQATPAPDAVVLESMYPTIAQAVEDRLAARLGPFVGALATPLLLWQLPLRLGIAPMQLRPLQKIQALGAPLLIVAGTLDQHTTAAETQQLYEAASAPKDLWMVEGAAHVDLQRFDPKGYEARVLPFLKERLQARLQH